MSFIRGKQRVVTALFPHQGNRRFIVPGRLPCDPPAALGDIGLQEWPVGVGVNFSVAPYFTGSNLQYSYFGFLPTGVTFENGAFVGTPTTEGQAGGGEVRAFNGCGEAFSDITISVVELELAFSLTVGNNGTSYGWARGGYGSAVPDSIGERGVNQFSGVPSNGNVVFRMVDDGQVNGLASVEVEWPGLGPIVLPWNGADRYVLVDVPYATGIAAFDGQTDVIVLLREP